MDINLPYRTVENIKTLGSLKGFLRTCDIKFNESFCIWMVWEDEHTNRQWQPGHCHAL